jgi:hypothetical protein
MHSGSIARLAERLINVYGHKVMFEVDPLDEDMSTFLQRALETYGCMVRRDPFGTRLTVTRPQELLSARLIQSPARC